MPISIKDVRVHFGQGASRVEALRGINFVAEVGKVSVVIGPSGSGKSTLLSILGLMLTPDSGVIHWDDTSMAGMSDDARSDLRLRSIGFVFQTPNLIESLTAHENVALPARLAGQSPKAAAMRTQVLLDQLGVSSRAHTFPSVMSGGEAQRVALCRALVNQPQLILADEPTAALDTANGHRVGELLRTAAQKDKAAVVIVTHDQRLADIADLTYKMVDGELHSG